MKYFHLQQQRWNLHHMGLKQVPPSTARVTSQCVLFGTGALKWDLYMAIILSMNYKLDLCDLIILSKPRQEHLTHNRCVY